MDLSAKFTKATAFGFEPSFPYENRGRSQRGARRGKTRPENILLSFTVQRPRR